MKKVMDLSEPGKLFRGSLKFKGTSPTFFRNPGEARKKKDAQYALDYRMTYMESKVERVVYKNVLKLTCKD